MGNKKPQRPTVLVTGPDRHFKPAWWAFRFQLWRTGLNAVYLSPNVKPQTLNVDGVIIGGGSDIAPIHYGEKIKAGTVYDPERDRLELKVIKFALKTDLPLLGVCRGAQLINVARGGNLYSDLRPLRDKTPKQSSIFTFKDALVNTTSKLGHILQRTCIRINSLHNQAVKKLGHNLTAVAHDNDGFVQAIEDPSRTFLLGVQWHPEYLPLNQTQKRLFIAFAKTIKARCDRQQTSDQFTDTHKHLSI